MTVTGSGKDLLLVIGDAIDAGKLARKLKEEVGEAEILELRTLPGRAHDALSRGASSKDTVVTLSPDQRHPTLGQSVPGGGRIEWPVVAAAQRWPGEHDRQAVSYYHRTPARDTTSTTDRRRWRRKAATATATRGAAACMRARWRAATR